uniref:Immunoglobulin V-set domain-containing protein n=1 Tax=Oryzias latipes TaxID=8090 RepID=A0A3B3HA77_ORYLA
MPDRDSLVDAETNIYTKREGEDITVRCYLKFSGSRKLLCKETCEEGNILIDTTSNEDQRGRYSIKYEYHLIGSSILDVTITKLTKSDSGWYRCKNSFTSASLSLSTCRLKSPVIRTLLYLQCINDNKSENSWIKQEGHFGGP